MTSHIVRSLPKDAQHRIIAGRYKADARAKGRARRVSTANRRIWELEKIFRHRFGKLLPNNSVGREALQVVAEAFSLAGGSARERLTGYISARAPWALADVGGLEAAAELVAKWQSADEMAWRIGLTRVEHDTLCIRTIGIVGLNKRQRKAIQREKKRRREAERRRANGAKPRVQYEAESISRAKPWEAEGTSKATWYRRRKAERETSACPLLSSHVSEHAVVSASPCSGRDALRAGPKGPWPDGFRHSEQAEGAVDYFGKEGLAMAEARA